MRGTYRLNVAVILTDGNGRVLLCERKFPDVEKITIQTVQGGVDDGETLRQAAEREVREELGIGHEDFTIVDELKEAFSYRWPDAYLAEHNLPNETNTHIGQEQHFFLAVLDPNTPLQLDAHHREFDSVRWGSVQEMLRGLWEPKRPGMESALRAFELL